MYDTTPLGEDTTLIEEVNKVLQSSRDGREKKVHNRILGFVPPFPQNLEESSKYGASRPPQELVRLIEDMLKIDEKARPKSAEINRALRTMGGQELDYHSDCCALSEPAPAPDWVVTPEVTGMEVNRDLGTEMERLREGREKPKKLFARNPFGSTSSQLTHGKSMFGMGEPRDEHRERLKTKEDGTLHYFRWLHI